MADGDKLILGNANIAQSQTSLFRTDFDDNKVYALQVEGPDGDAIGGLSGVGNGVEGISASGIGVSGSSTSAWGVAGSSPNGYGVAGGSNNNIGVVGTSFQSSGVEGYSFGPGAGVTGGAVGPNSGPGVVGLSVNSFGVRGQSGAANLLPPVGGGHQFQVCGVQGSSDDGTGVRGDSAHKVGVRGRTFTGDGIFGSCIDPPKGQTKGNAIHGQAPRSAANTLPGPFAGLFEGDVAITGRLFVGGHLFHQFVFAGVVTLNAKGKAVVALPQGTSDLHGQFSYQLTPIGGPLPNLHIAEEIKGNKFKIAGGTAKVKVAWQVAGELKQRRVANAHAPEQPLDGKMAQEHSLRSKTFTRLAGELEIRMQHLLKR